MPTKSSKTKPSKKGGASATTASTTNQPADTQGRPVDRNHVSLVGRLAITPDVRVFASGTSHARLLVTTRIQTDRPRTDVVPVTVWNPDSGICEADRGEIVAVTGNVQRRFWTSEEGRRSRVEVVAHTVELLGQFEEE